MACAYPGCLGSLVPDEWGDSDSLGVSVRYIGFDFHEQCGKMASKKGGESISRFLASLQPHMDRHRFFFKPDPEHADEVLNSTQMGLFRVNCIDCLDRTNVFESASCLHVFYQQLA
eukprot:CAMPEP_0173455512 /NCGR_PEP_ID=MMETSP1357-20121228/54404_1 /TAXON_ID=77926 /ORGANISM="Hemiselmis rufescens, Strain PCC563" /LENGTH=115 /DNA_ID=CAMNT_0014422651 /DNA_START=41 /DNA_END=384 /DNA_ORIENTATION=-